MSFQQIQEKTQPSQLDSRTTTVAAPKVLLAENVRWPNVALLAISLARAGCNVAAVCPAHHPLLKTRAVRQTFPYSGLRPLESLSTAIKANHPDIIIPCDDRAVQHLHELHAKAHRLGPSENAMAALIEKSLGTPESYPIVFGRYELLQIAREEGLRVPDTEPINSADDLKSWQKRQVFPWVLKTDGTYGGNGVKIAHTIEQAGQFWTELTRFYSAARAVKRLCVNRDAFWVRSWWNRTRPAISVQSYIQGRPANCAVACWKGSVLAVIGVEAVNTKDQTGPATVVRVVDNPDMMLCAERLAGRLGLSGFFGLDFMIEAKSGLTYLVEMNPRLTRPACLQLGKGRDLVGALCAKISNQPFQEKPPVTQKETIAYFPDALNCKNELLESSFHDKPDGEPDLVQELTKPWPPRGLFWHLINQVDHFKKYMRGSD